VSRPAGPGPSAHAAAPFTAGRRACAKARSAAPRVSAPASACENDATPPTALSGALPAAGRRHRASAGAGAPPTPMQSAASACARLAASRSSAAAARRRRARAGARGRHRPASTAGSAEPGVRFAICASAPQAPA
jgi:hypothetical protein